RTRGEDSAPLLRARRGGADDARADRRRAEHHARARPPDQGKGALALAAREPRAGARELSRLVAGITTPLRIAPVTLTGRFVRLEPLTRDHVDALARFAYEPSLWTWTAMQPLDRPSLEAWVEEGLAGGGGGTGVPFVTALIEKNLLVGSTRVLNISARDGRMEIG